MRASAHFYDWREYGFELVLKVRLQTGPLFFLAKDPQNRTIALYGIFWHFTLILGKSSYELCHQNFRSPRYLESGRNHFLKSTFSSHFEEECYKIALSFVRTSGAHKCGVLFVEQSPCGWYNRFFWFFSGVIPSKMDRVSRSWVHKTSHTCT